MTTTAEKIKVMQAFENGAKIQETHFDSSTWDGPECKEYRKAGGNAEPIWSFDRHKYRIKPQKPLECWVVLNQDGIIVRAQLTTPDNKCWKKVRMRQVTPQDEQDRKDAARFRRLVEMAGVAWQPGNTEWCQAVPGNLLREEIDKAMEEG